MRNNEHNNIAIIILDTLRYDFFKKFFNWLPGKNFIKAYSTSHWTIPSHASLFTGKYPSEIGVHSKSPNLDCQDKVIAEILKENGYNTRFYTANTNLTAWGEDWKRGFDQFIQKPLLNPKDEGLINWSSFAREHKNYGVLKLFFGIKYCFSSDKPTFPSLLKGYKYWKRNKANGGTKDIIKRIESTKFQEKEFLVINLMETHPPYHPPNKGSKPINVTTSDSFTNNVYNPEKVRSAYSESAKYLSKTYKNLFYKLRKNFDYIITLSDHGEMLGENNMWNHGYGLYPELVHIPLVISGKNIEDKTEDNIVNILDVHKTIGKLADIDLTSRGKNLLKSPNHKSFLTEYHGFLPFQSEQIERKNESEEVFKKRDTKLYGIVMKEGYAYQTHTNGLQSRSKVSIKKFKNHLNNLKESISERNVETIKTENIDESVKNKLKDLGYI